MRTIVGFLISAFMFCSCQKKDELVISKKDGIVIIHNPEKPLREDIQYLQFSEIFRIGDNSDKVNEFFHLITDISVDKNHNIYIAVQGNNSVQKFDQNGNFIKIIGSNGSGPGEYTSPGLILNGAQNETIIFDRAIDKLIHFDPDGTFLKERWISDKTQNHLLSPLFLDSHTLLMLTKLHNRDPKSLINVNEIVSYNLENQEIRKLLTFNVDRQVLTEESGGFMTRSKWETNFAISPQREIFVSNSMDYELFVYAENGNKIKEIRRAYKNVPLSNKEKASIKGPTLGNGKTFSPPECHSDILAFYFVVPNELWVITSNVINEQNVIDVFDNDGKFIKQISVNIPLNLKRSYSNYLHELIFDETTNSLHLFQVERNADDVEIVVCYKAKYQ